MMVPVKIVIADENQIFVEGIKTLIRQNRKYELPKVAYSPQILFRILQSESPDILIVSSEFSGFQESDFLESLFKIHPQVKLLLFFDQVDEQELFNVIQKGVKGILLKKCTEKELINAIESISANAEYYGEHIKNILLKGLKNYLGEKNEKETMLTKREGEVLKLYASGLSYKEIARQLHISARTVETHKSNISKKLNVKTNSGLIKYAIKSKMIFL